MSSMSKKKQPVNFTEQYKKILKGITVFVDTLNEDGTDASKANADILRAMGATVAPAFGEGVDMLIWSTYSTSKRFAAATAFSIPVVSSLWIDSCRENNSLADVGDFYFPLPGNGGNSNSSNNSYQTTTSSLPVGIENDALTGAASAAGASQRVVIREPQLNQVAGMRHIESPFYSSSQRVESPVGDPVKLMKRKSALKTSNKKMASIEEEATCEQDTQVVDTNVSVAAAAAPLAAATTEVKRKLPVDLEALSKGGAKRTKGGATTASQTQDAGAAVADKPVKEKAAVAVKASKVAQSKAKPKQQSADSSALVLAVSGFDDAAREGGEKATVKNAAEEFTAFMNRSKCKQGGAVISASVVDTDSELNTDIALTHVIANSSSSKRSLRIIYAMARGIPIVTEEWLYACVEAEQWILGDVTRYCHSRYEDVPHEYKCQEIFEGKSFVIAETSDPPAAFMSTLVRTCQGSVVRAASDYVVFETQRDADEWSAKKSSDAGAAVTNKYIFDCIERNVLLPLARFKGAAAAAKVSKVVPAKAASLSIMSPPAAKPIATPASGSEFMSMLAQVPGQMASFFSGDSSRGIHSSKKDGSREGGSSGVEKRKRKDPSQEAASSQEILSGDSCNNILSPISLTQISYGGATGGRMPPTPKQLSAIKSASSKKSKKEAQSIRFGNGENDDEEAVWDENDAINRRVSTGSNSSALDTSRMTDATAIVDEETESFQYNVDTYNDDF